MKPIKFMVLFLFAQTIFLTNVFAGDFDWLKNLNIEAKADLSSFRLKLASRFNIGDAEIKTVIRATDKPSDAYMIFRLGEMTHRTVDDVIRVYRPNKKRGWGYMAKKLGIKPGSHEFHELKERHDFYHEPAAEHGHHHDNDNGMGREKHHGNNHGHGKSGR